MDMVLIFKISLMQSLIIKVLILTKPLKIGSNRILKIFLMNWYGEINLKIRRKKKPIKSIRIKNHLAILIMYPLGTKHLTNEKKTHFESTFENKIQFSPFKSS
jgi:hypothetical protein